MQADRVYPEALVPGPDVSAVAELDLPFLDAVVIGSAQISDLYHDWHRVREVHEAGAVLVRPDSYVAWSYVEPVWEQQAAVQLLQDALTSILEDRSRRADEAEHPAVAQASDQDRTRT